MKRIRPNYYKIYEDYILQNCPEKLHLLKKFEQKKELGNLDVIRLNRMLFQHENAKFKAYDKKTILKILKYQEKNQLSNVELAKELNMSRNTLARWKKQYTV